MVNRDGPPPIRVLIVDDHDLVAGALARVLAEEPDIEVVGIAASLSEAKRQARTRPDVVLMDYRLPDGTGADATRLIKAAWPRARVVMLSALTDDDTILASIQAGADGYLTKYRAIAEVVAVVRDAAAGAVLLAPDLLAEISRRTAESKMEDLDQLPTKPLSPRELQVLRLLASGKSTAEIADRLQIRDRTVGEHVRNLMAKLGVHSRLEAVAFAYHHRMVESRGE
jgi:two-component system, NarL family, nitrate/nitrite response regulator NarL